MYTILTDWPERYEVHLIWRQYADRLCGLVVRVPGYRSREPGFDYRRYQIFWEVVGLEQGPLSLMRIIEKLLVLWRNSSGSGLENREYGRGDPLRWPRDTLYPQKLALTSPTCGSRLVGIVRLRTKTTEIDCLMLTFTWGNWGHLQPWFECVHSE
jgi:hypothetical protein